jgi:hypothetical protein
MPLYPSSPAMGFMVALYLPAASLLAGDGDAVAGGVAGHGMVCGALGDEG